MMDTMTLGVLTTLLVDVVGLAAIIMGFVIIRRYRGDKVTVSAQGVIAQDVNEFIFEESLDSHRLDEKLDYDSELVRKKTIDLQWAVSEEETLYDDESGMKNELKKSKSEFTDGKSDEKVFKK